MYGMAGINAVKAEVISAEALDGARLEALRAVLSEKCGGPVDIDLQVDPSLIAGFSVMTHGCLFDGTFLSKINGMKDYIMQGDYAGAI
jgi:F0F1-type ATP synthase delta subunit